jgi:hypothetical protein
MSAEAKYKVVDLPEGSEKLVITLNVEAAESVQNHPPDGFEVAAVESIGNLRLFALIPLPPSEVTGAKPEGAA